MKQLQHWIARLNLVFVWIAGLCSLVLVLLTTQQVLARYLFSESSIAMQELERYLFAAIFLLASGFALSQDKHVRVDILYSRLSAKGKAWIDGLGTLLFLIPSMGVLLWYGWDYAASSRNFPSAHPLDHWSKGWFEVDSVLYSVSAAIEGFLRTTILVGEGSPNPGGLEAIWLVKLMIPICAVLVLLQGVSMLIDSLRTVVSGEGA